MSRTVHEEPRSAPGHDGGGDPTTTALTAAADALAEANQQVEVLERARRDLSDILAGLLRALPLPIVVCEAGVVRACSDAARAAGVHPGGPLDPLGREVVEAATQLTAANGSKGSNGGAATIGGGWCAAKLEAGRGEPARVLLWQLPPD